MPARATIIGQVNGEQTKALDTGAASAPFGHNVSLTFENGTGAGLIDRVFSDTRTIAASGTDDLDLAGVLLDAYGATDTFARVKVVLITTAAANINNVVVGGAAATQFIGPFGAATHTFAIRPGGFMMFSVGAADATAYAVTAGTADLFRIANGGAGSSVDYTITILGTSV